MKKIKPNEIENYIVENYGTMKHDKYAFAEAINEVSYAVSYTHLTLPPILLV